MLERNFFIFILIFTFFLLLLLAWRRTGGLLSCHQIKPGLLQFVVGPEPVAGVGSLPGRDDHGAIEDHRGDGHVEICRVVQQVQLETIRRHFGRVLRLVFRLDLRGHKNITAKP